MNIDPAAFGQGPTKTDEGFTIEYHGQNGCNQATISLGGPSSYEQVPQVRLNGKRYVYDYLDEVTGHLIFTEFDGTPPALDDEPTPDLPSEFDDVEPNANREPWPGAAEDLANEPPPSEFDEHPRP